VVKSFVRERYEEEKFKKANIDLKESTMKAMKIVIFTIPAMSLAMNITIWQWFGLAENRLLRQYDLRCPYRICKLCYPDTHITCNGFIYYSNSSRTLHP